MTLPISGGEVATQYSSLWNVIKRVQADCLNLQASTAGGAACRLSLFLQLAQDSLSLTKLYDQFASNQTVANGVIAYAQQQSPGVTFGGSDFTATRNAAGSILTAIASQYPHDATGKLLDRTWSSTDGEVWATATAAQAPTIMTAISAFLATLS